MLRKNKNAGEPFSFESVFDNIIAVLAEDIEIELRGHLAVPWSDFILNPRRLRGSDFLMRWSQGVWSEHRITAAINKTNKYFALPYGPSGTAPDDVREFELYFERLEAAGLGELKRPDILIFGEGDREYISNILRNLGGIGELPFIPEERADIQNILSKSILAVECENSLWRPGRMPDFNTELKPMKRLGGKPGLSKNAVLPTVIIKEEDRKPLLTWQKKWNIDIHVWHVFYDMAFGISVSDIEKLIKDGLIEPTEQVFQAPNGITTKKVIYKIYYQYAYLLGQTREEPTLIPAYIEDKNGHILPYVKFEGGWLEISQEALKVIGDFSVKAAGRE